MTSQAAAELADVAAIFWPWSESDSGKSYNEKATFFAAQQRYIALMRGWVGQSASAVPWLLWNAIPFRYFTLEPGNQMIRESCYDQTQASGQNAWIVLPQTSDSISRSATGNADGTWNATGGGGARGGFDGLAIFEAWLAQISAHVDKAGAQNRALGGDDFGLVAALTFQLAADIIETSVSASWESLGRIAVIAVIRTFLNYFLEKDMRELSQGKQA